MSPRPVHFRLGFTLVELLTVIAITGILIAIAIPALGVLRERARDSQCKSNLKQLITAYILYVQDNDGKVPTDGTTDVWCKEVDPYMSRPFSTDMHEMYRCPLVAEDPAALWWNADYGANIHGAIRDAEFVTTAPVMLNGINTPAQLIAFIDWIPKWRFARVFEYALVNGADKDLVFRHNGRVNAVFVDGHVASLPWPIPTDYTMPPWRSPP